MAAAEDASKRIFPSLPEDPQLSDLFKRFPHAVAPLVDYHDRLLRDSSPLTVAERELIAAFVSGLNACHFCHGAHILAAKAYGIDDRIFSELMADPQTASIEPRLKPILAYVRKLTLSLASISPSDAQAVYDAGWDEQALFDAVSVCALFNMMNRIVLGAGILNDPRLKPPEEVQARTKRMGTPGGDPHRAERSYGRLLELWGIPRD